MQVYSVSRRGGRLSSSSFKKRERSESVSPSVMSHGLFVTPWTVARQAPLSMRFSRQEKWSGVPFPSPGDLSNPGIKLRSPALQADSLPSEPPGKQGQMKRGWEEVMFFF